MQMILVLILGVGSVLFILMGMRRGRKASPNLEERLSSFGVQTKTLAEREQMEGFSTRVLKPAVRRMSNSLGNRSPAAALDKTRMKLAQAGNPSGMGPVEFLGLRYLVAAGLGGGFFLLVMFAGIGISMAALIGLACGALGFMMPNIWLDRKRKARRKEITRSLPDAIDLLTISVESGLGFDPALQRVAEKWDNALTREFARVLSEMRIGKTKREALREMTVRADEDGLTTFVSSVIQADTLGVPITQVLRIQSEAMRVRRRQKAEEMAQKAPLKMLFPMVFLIFPALYVIILGPAVPQIVKALG
ncbi:MAG TPA: type II secretion system F family protein [Thermomicrobiales bacterium]|nr:type II secretion system F family protein [Thermomicrobiales bacterium]HRA48066.1 type II secretion system F family protein [Thermomicrobiales bacterium]